MTNSKYVVINPVDKINGQWYEYNFKTEKF